MKFHLAILTYDALADTQRCLASVFENTVVPCDVHILDNASRDSTVAWLTGMRDRLASLHCSDVNLGVPGGRNVLLAHILQVADDDDLIVFLDNDIEVHEGWHEPFERLFERDDRVGLASKVGWVMRVRGETRDPLTHPCETARVDIVAGGFACCARVRAAREVGPLDENLGLFWHEDDDWALRFTHRGWSVWAVPEASMTHHEHGSGVAFTTLADGASVRNLRYLTDKWRALGYVDEEGWVRDSDPLFVPPRDVRDTIARRIGRKGALCRGEYAQAYWDLQALHVANELGQIFPRPISPCLRALLDLIVDGKAFDMCAEMRARMTRLRDALEVEHDRRSPAWTKAPISPRPDVECGIARTNAWDDPRWFARFVELRGETVSDDWYSRHADDWAATTIYASIARRCESGESPSVWFAGEDCLRLAGALESAGARIATARESSPIDVAIVDVPLLTDLDDPRVSRQLDIIQDRLSRGATVLVATAVLVGEDGHCAFDPAAALSLRARGLTATCPFDGGSDPDVFAMVVPQVVRGRGPRFGYRIGTGYVTRALVALRASGTRRVTAAAEIVHGLADLRGVDWNRAAITIDARDALVRLAVLVRDGTIEMVVADGPCPPLLQPVLAGHPVRYRAAVRDLERTPRTVHHFELPRLEAASLATWPDSEHVRHVPPRAAADVAAFDLDRSSNRGIGGTRPVRTEVYWPGLQARTTLAWSPCPVHVVRSHYGLAEPYAVVDATRGMHEDAAHALHAIVEELSAISNPTEGAVMLLYGPSAAMAHERLSSAVRTRVRFVTSVPDDVRRPLLDGAAFFVDVSGLPDRGPGSYEALDVGLRELDPFGLSTSSMARRTGAVVGSTGS
ncbi:MAG: glycosyltransferase [Planctomycetes bacterium]|nr:glycosyltransferase [Planctomycetota bacterium]MCB9918280.1 glycosyltransferase [Planctomycetota bacterium]